MAGYRADGARPCAIARPRSHILLLRLRRHAVADRCGAASRVEVLRRSCWRGPCRAQPDAHDVRSTGVSPTSCRGGPLMCRRRRCASSRILGLRHDGCRHRARLPPWLGIETVLLDATRSSSPRRQGSRAAAVLAKDVQRGKRTQVDADAVLARDPHDDEAMRARGLRPGRRRLCSRSARSRQRSRKTAEAVLGTDAVFASNASTPRRSAGSRRHRSAAHSSSASISSRRSTRCRSVEIIVGSKTTGDDRSRGARLRAAAAQDADRRQRQRAASTRAAVSARSSTRACRCCQEGVAPALIENAATDGRHGRSGRSPSRTRSRSS